MPANRLIHEKSPYLLQHAQNPVDWYPWGEEAFEKARAEDKPIFLSIGYSTCHWCHVMERESFENDEIAAILNRSFVAVKVDREERPDVDRVYMTYVQAATGSGGWPMSVWLAPDLKPFFGGTYFPPDGRYGRPGFGSLLTQIATAWMTDRARIAESGRDAIEQLKRATAAQATGTIAEESRVRNRCFLQFRRIFDPRLGGFGGPPKFPRPVTLNFLLRESIWSANEEARDMVLLTLREMAKGGMHDQVGGGFHRYSVDGEWFVPHFEKMLYDQAQLAVAYVEAHQLTGDALYANIARRIFEYVERDLRHPDGGFYSAEDADSVADSAHPHEKREGAFYVWTDAEIQEALGDEASWFRRRYGVQPEGNVRAAQDPHQEFTGQNILFLASEAGSPEQVAEAHAKLMAIRAGRVRPHLDDKVLAAWNGLMISAFAKGAQALGDPRYLDLAREAARFIRERMFTADGILLRRWREGEAAIPGFLDDYASLGNAFLDLYETDFDPADLAMARTLAAQMRLLFEDVEHGGFFSTVDGDENLVLRMKEDYDGAEPSGNAMAIQLLLRLDDREPAERALRAFASRLEDSPMTLPQMVIALAASQRSSQQIVFAGDREAIRPLVDAAHRRFSPFRVLLHNPSDHPEFQPLGGQAAAYVCQDFTCQLPVTTAGDLDRLLT